MLFAEYTAQFLTVLEYGLVAVFLAAGVPLGVRLVSEEIRETFSQFFEMREDNRKNQRRMAQLVRDAEVRWEQRMGVKTSG